MANDADDDLDEVKVDTTPKRRLQKRRNSDRKD